MRFCVKNSNLEVTTERENIPKMRTEHLSSVERIIDVMHRENPAQGSGIRTKTDQSFQQNMAVPGHWAFI